MTEFQEKVINAVKLIPHGKVASYGQIALYLNRPRGARAVGWILRGIEAENIPWWRVVNNAGRVSIKGNVYHTANTQRKLLIDEGVMVNDLFTFDIEAYRFRLE